MTKTTVVDKVLEAKSIERRLPLVTRKTIATLQNLDRIKPLISQMVDGSVLNAKTTTFMEELNAIDAKN